jgi:hypothetical protein
VWQNIYHDSETIAMNKLITLKSISWWKSQEAEGGACQDVLYQLHQDDLRAKLSSIHGPRTGQTSWEEVLQTLFGQVQVMSVRSRHIPRSFWTRSCKEGADKTDTRVCGTIMILRVPYNWCAHPSFPDSSISLRVKDGNDDAVKWDLGLFL